MSKGRMLLALAGSPRQGGNSDALLDWAVAAAAEAGAEVVRYRVSDLALSGCTGCGACHATGECVIQDDFQLLFPHLCRVESILLAAPVFSLGLPAQVKALVDRCQTFWAAREILHRRVWPEDGPERRSAFLCCAGSGDQGVFDCSRRTVRYLWSVLEAHAVGELMAPAVDQSGDILRQAGARPVAQDIGRRLALP